jgi:hypothetical protein
MAADYTEPRARAKPRNECDRAAMIIPEEA